jgi:DNA-binding MarR family transcriptional regulator
VTSDSTRRSGLTSKLTSPNTSAAQPSGAQGVLRLLAGKWIAAAVGTAAELGIADALYEQGARSCDDLAGELGCDAQSLGRLLRVLAVEGLLERDADGYRLTELGEALHSDALRDLAVYTVSPFVWTPWGQLSRAIREGEAAFDLTHGVELFSYLDQNPSDGELYQAAVDAFTRHESQALKDAFSFADVSSVVDVGGGLATTLIELLTAHPHLQGTLVERERVIAQARNRVVAADLDLRLSFWAGDFFEEVPAGGDVYVLMHVLHNWDDGPATRLLKNCSDAMGQNGRILIIDSFVLPGDIKDGTTLLDLEMMTLLGRGRERTKPQFRQLLAGAGLKLIASPALAGSTRLLICEKKQ